MLILVTTALCVWRPLDVHITNAIAELDILVTIVKVKHNTFFVKSFFLVIKHWTNNAD